MNITFDIPKIFSTGEIETIIRSEIKKDYLNRKNFYYRKALYILQEVIDIDYQITDRGRLARNTGIKVINENQGDTLFEYLYNSNNVIDETSGEYYDKLVYYGLGTNRPYGQRRYLEAGANRFSQFLTNGSYTRDTKKGSPNKGRRIIKSRII